MTIDLHSHTTASDGALEPRELIERAVTQGVKTLSITDHDSIAAYQQLQPQADLPLQLIPGIELSTVWQGISIHVLALNIRLDSVAILTAVSEQGHARAERAELIGARLAKLGIKDAYDGARKLAGKGWIGRPHFARYLVDSGVVPDENRAFRKYLGNGKPGDVKQLWPPLEKIIEWTRDSNGTAVLAHPSRYGLTRSKLNRMLDGFVAAGGQGIEVVSGRQRDEEIGHE
jgi:predicted metal-dependent phosphoesterase TrpH